jgi:hypothetical protein
MTCTRGDSRAAKQAPACANEWVRGVCEKPRVKCAECPNRRFLRVTDDVIRWHLSGCDPEGQPFVAGVYPLLHDETCFFLAVDFDQASWRDDAAAFRDTCRDLNVPVALERSRSGRGAHVWLFFDEAIPAALARRLGSHVLTETMKRRPEIGLDSYDRLFPNQDTMPQGGFGNLIALPLQRAPRKQDNTIFLDSAFVPWARSVGASRERSKDGEAAGGSDRRGRRTTRAHPRRAVATTGRWRNRAVDRTSVTSKRGSDRRGFASTLDVVLGNQIYTPKQGLNPGLRNRLLRLAAFQNAEFYKAQAMRLSTYNKPRVVACAASQVRTARR